MTENEAIREFQQNIDMPFGSNISREASELAIQALEEVQKYREIGALEELQDMKSDYYETLSDWRQYRKIGTLEECRTAREKQVTKKPVHDGCFDSEGIWHEWNGVNGRPYDLCPNCNTNLCCEMPYDNKPKYCKHCGQRLDWSDEE